MALKDKIPQLLAHINANRNYLELNRVILDIYNGNLFPYVDEVLSKTLSVEYYNQIKSRIILINVLKRITAKTSKAYKDRPDRYISNELLKKDLEFYEAKLNVNVIFKKSDAYSNLFKGYALEPFVDQGEPKLRALPFDRFLPYSDNQVDPSKMTEFIKFMGKKLVNTAKGPVLRDVFHVYSSTEFLAFDSEGDVYSADLEGNDGINPYGVIPFYYGNRGNDELLPTQDTDTLSLTKMVPIMLTDLAGAIMFQCFSIVYGIDVNAENLKMSPNAFWSLKSEAKSDKQPEVGTIKPEADIDKVMNFVVQTFTLWLETRGIRAGSMGALNTTNLASGISKVIDEMDTSELIQENQTEFVNDETEFWAMFGQVQNYWITSGQLNNSQYRLGQWPKDIVVAPKFDAPTPVVDRKTQVETVKLEVDSGFLPRKEAIKRLYPDLPAESVDEWMAEINEPITIEEEPEQDAPLEEVS